MGAAGTDDGITPATFTALGRKLFGTRGFATVNIKHNVNGDSISPQVVVGMPLSLNQTVTAEYDENVTEYEQRGRRWHDEERDAPQSRVQPCTEALGYSRRSLRLGTRDASFFFHRGMIERCLGRPAQARAAFSRALAINPYHVGFSMWEAIVEKQGLERAQEIRRGGGPRADEEVPDRREAGGLVVKSEGRRDAFGTRFRIDFACTS